MRGRVQCYMWVEWDGIRMGWDGYHDNIIGNRSSKSTFGAKKGNLKPTFFILGGSKGGASS